MHACRNLPTCNVYHLPTTDSIDFLVVCLQAFEDGFTKEQLFELTNIDPWFLSQLEGLHETEEWLRTRQLSDLTAEDFWQTKRRGFSDPQIARFVGARPPSHTCRFPPRLSSPCGAPHDLARVHTSCANIKSRRTSFHPLASISAH